MNKDVMIVTGAGQIGMAIARRVGFGKKIIQEGHSRADCHGAGVWGDQVSCECGGRIS